MLSSEPGNRYATTRVDYVGRGTAAVWAAYGTRAVASELLYVAALFHVLGLVDAYHTDTKRFEVDGADAARKNKSGSTAIVLATHNTGRGGTGSPEAKEQQREILRLLENRPFAVFPAG